MSILLQLKSLAASISGSALRNMLISDATTIENEANRIAAKVDPALSVDGLSITLGGVTRTTWPSPGSASVSLYDVLQNGAVGNIPAGATDMIIKNSDGSVTLLTLNKATGNLTILGTITAGGTLSPALATAATHAPQAGQMIGKNLLINPSGEIYQRAIAATANDTYFADCWYALTQTGTVLPSQLAEPEDGFNAGVRLTQSQVTAQRFGYAQIIEGKKCKHLRGGSATFIPRIRVSTSQAIRYAILGWTGTEDTVTSNVVLNWASASYTAGGFFLAANVSVLAVGTQTPTANTWTSLAALTATMGSTFKNVIIMVWTDGTAAQNFTLDFDFHQLEKGVFATTFERKDIHQIDRECQRYYPKLMDYYDGTLVQFGSSTVAYAKFRMQVPPRVAPTGIALSATTDFQLYGVTATTSFASIVYQHAGLRDVGIVITANASVGTTANQAGTFLSNGGAGAKIYATGCEL